MESLPGFLIKFLKRYSFFAFLLLPFAFLSFAALAQAEANVATYDALLKAIRETHYASEQRIEQAVDQEKVREAWETGKLIREHILLNKERADYGKKILKRLSGDLGISETELEYRVEFVRAYPISQPAGKLSWSHYASLLSINDSKERQKIEDEASQGNWNRQKLRDEIKKRKLTVPEVEVKLEAVQPGKPGVYRIVEMKDAKYYDLGFSTYRKVKENSRKTNPLESELYTYNAVVTQVFDGDTFHAYVDLGFEIILEQRLRLRALDAPEILSADGKEAKAVLEKALFRDKEKILIKVAKSDDQYGRYLVDVWVKDKNINQELLNSGLLTVRGDE